MRETGHWIKNPNYRVFPDYGKGRCRYCGKEIPPERRYYCNDICAANYRRCKDKEMMEWWPQFRERMFKRDNYTCMDCGYTANHKRATDDRDWKDQRTLALHHIIPISKGGAMWEEGNVETLCDEKCHKFKHRMRYLEPTLDSKQTELKDFKED